jgi:hypothetical protein
MEKRWRRKSKSNSVRLIQHATSSLYTTLYNPPTNRDTFRLALASAVSNIAYYYRTFGDYSLRVRARLQDVRPPLQVYRSFVPSDDVLPSL